MRFVFPLSLADLKKIEYLNLVQMRALMVIRINGAVLNFISGYVDEGDRDYREQVATMSATTTMTGR